MKSIAKFNKGFRKVENEQLQNHFCVSAGYSLTQFQALTKINWLKDR